MKILAKDVQAGQRVRLGNLERVVTGQANGFIYFATPSCGVPHTLADAIGIELIEPLVIRDVVSVNESADSDRFISYTLQGDAVNLLGILENHNARPGDTFDLVLTKREAN